MPPRIVLSLAILAALAGSAVPARAQEVIAEVRTWSGQSWTLAQPSLHVFYTVIPKAEEAEPSPPGGRTPTVFVFGLRARPSEPQRPEPLKAQEQVEILPLSRQGVLSRIPLANIATLVFSRQPVPGHPFLPSLLPTLFRYSVTAFLTDGSRLEADDVSLGTMVLRGMTPQGRVDIPWEELEMIRFRR